MVLAYNRIIKTINGMELEFVHSGDSLSLLEIPLRFPHESKLNRIRLNEVYNLIILQLFVLTQGIRSSCSRGRARPRP